MTILGPTNVTGVSDTISRRRVFTCRPTTALEEEPCAARIIKDLTARAYRGKGTAQGASDAMQFYLEGRRTGDFEERHPHGAAVDPGQPACSCSGSRRGAGQRRARRAVPHRRQDLASRLSFFLWGTGPDAPLMAAAAGRAAARPPAQIEAQVRRMLADRRSEALATRFASQWLRLQDLDELQPEFTEYPQFDETLRDAMRRETQLFFDSIVREDRSVLDLLTADY